MAENKNYYDILEISVKASFEEITSAKNALAKKYHPDANMKEGIDTTEQMQEILEAYAVLSDPAKRMEYDRKISGYRPHMQTFDLKNEEDLQEDSGFITCWKASRQLYDIIAQSNELVRQKDTSSRMAQLAMEALPYILLLRDAGIPEKYWHPDTMNWLLLASYKNRNLTNAYLLTLYDEHMKKDIPVKAGLKLRNQSMRYTRSLKRLMKY